jgi:hypothetical protein
MYTVVIKDPKERKQVTDALSLIDSSFRETVALFKLDMDSGVGDDHYDFYNVHRNKLLKLRYKEGRFTLVDLYTLAMILPVLREGVSFRVRHKVDWLYDFMFSKGFTELSERRMPMMPKGSCYYPNPK